MTIHDLTIRQALKHTAKQIYCTPMTFKTFAGFNEFRKRLVETKFLSNGRLTMRLRGIDFQIDGYLIYHRVNGEQRLPTLWVYSDQNQMFKNQMGQLECFIDEFGFNNDWQVNFLQSYIVGLSNEQLDPLVDGMLSQMPDLNFEVKRLNGLLYQILYLKLKHPFHHDELRNTLIQLDQILWQDWPN